jgi:hypothetical protein
MRCRRSVRDRHAEQVSEATGAAGVQIGPRTIALAAKLNKECGMSYGRIAAFFEAAFGIKVAASTLSRALARLATLIEPLHDQIGQQIRAGPVLSPDETGWRIGGNKAWLHTAATRDASYYLIARGRGREEAEALIGREYGGTIVRDGWAPYRMFTKASAQTCLAHILRRAEGLLEVCTSRAGQQWLRKLSTPFKGRSAFETDGSRQNSAFMGCPRVRARPRPPLTVCSSGSRAMRRFAGSRTICSASAMR